MVTDRTKYDRVGKAFLASAVKLPQHLATLGIVESEHPGVVLIIVKRSVIPIENLSHALVGHFRLDFPDRFAELESRQVVIVGVVDWVSHYTF